MEAVYIVSRVQQTGIVVNVLSAYTRLDFSISLESNLRLQLDVYR
jgi:hypothetical protein